MSKKLKPFELIIVSILVVVIFGFVGYKMMLPSSAPQKSAATLQALDPERQQQADRFKLTADENAHYDKLPPYLKHAAENSSYQRNQSDLPQLLKQQASDPSKLTDDQKKFISHLPPYIIKQAQGDFANQHSTSSH